MHFEYNSNEYDVNNDDGDGGVVMDVEMESVEVSQDTKT